MVACKMTFWHKQLILSLPTAFLMNILLYGDPGALLNFIKQTYSTLKALAGHTCSIGLRMASFNHFKLPSIMSLYMSNLLSKWFRRQLMYLLNTPGQFLRLRTYSSHVFLVKEFNSPLDGYIHILSKSKFKEDESPAIEATCSNISSPMKPTCPPSSMTWHFNMVEYY